MRTLIRFYNRVSASPSMGTVRLLLSAKDRSRYFAQSALKKDLTSVWGQAMLNTVQFVNELGAAHGVTVTLCTLEEIMQLSEQTGPTLLLSGKLEPLIYSGQITLPTYVDGTSVAALLTDKYATYSAVKQCSTVVQPETFAIRSQSDLLKTLEQVTPAKVVLKPRQFSCESQNIYIVHSQRLQQLQADERLNFSNYILQVYNQHTIWPPIEWRFHYIGHQLCRCLRITDKNNWSGQFGHQDIPLTDLPVTFSMAAQTVIERLLPSQSVDNVTIDFLELDQPGQLLFLEANCGVLNSFMVMVESDKPAVQTIYEELFRRYKLT